MALANMTIYSVTVLVLSLLGPERGQPPTSALNKEEPAPLCDLEAVDPVSIPLLLERAEGRNRAFQASRWEELVTGYDDVTRMSTIELRAARRDAKRLVQEIKLESWELKRVFRCGTVAAVVQETRSWLPISGTRKGVRRVSIYETEWWNWREGSWFIIDDVRSALGSSRRQVKWNRSMSRFWLTEPEEEFVKAWTSDDRVDGLGVEEDPHNMEAPPELVSIWRERSKLSRECQLVSLVEAYGNVIASGRREEVRFFGEPGQYAPPSVVGSGIGIEGTVLEGGRVREFRIKGIAMDGPVGRAVVEFRVEARSGGGVGNWVEGTSYWLWFDGWSVWRLIQGPVKGVSFREIETNRESYNKTAPEERGKIAEGSGRRNGGSAFKSEARSEQLIDAVCTEGEVIVELLERRYELRELGERALLEGVLAEIDNISRSVGREFEGVLRSASEAPVRSYEIESLSMSEWIAKSVVRFILAAEENDVRVKIVPVTMWWKRGEGEWVLWATGGAGAEESGLVDLQVDKGSCLTPLEE